MLPPLDSRQVQARHSNGRRRDSNGAGGSPQNCRAWIKPRWLGRLCHRQPESVGETQRRPFSRESLGKHVESRGHYVFASNSSGIDWNSKIAREGEFILYVLIFWFQKMIVFLYQKIFSDIKKWISDIRYKKMIFWYQKMNFWYQISENDFLISENDMFFYIKKSIFWFQKWIYDIRKWFSDTRNLFLISENHLLISENMYDYFISEIHVFSDIRNSIFWCQKLFSDIRNSDFLISENNFQKLFSDIRKSGKISYEWKL